MDMSWSIKAEEDVYKAKDFTTLELPELPTSASLFKGWVATVTVNFSSIDLSPDDFIMRWLLICLQPVGDPRSVCQALHDNSQGLVRLDRYLGKLMSRPSNLSTSSPAGKIFGMTFGVYIEFCHSKLTS